jgi:hypothetical protein
LYATNIDNIDDLNLLRLKIKKWKLFVPAQNYSQKKA